MSDALVPDTEASYSSVRAIAVMAKNHQDVHSAMISAEKP